jgi:parallel beta-helix repeat protein
LPIVWEAVYDEGKSEFFSNVAVDSNGNLMVVGNVINYATGEAAGIVAKYNGDGGLLWLEKVQPYPFTNLNGIAVDPNNNIVAFGVTSTNPDMQDYGGSQIAEWLIAKFYPNGTLMWQTYYRKEGMGYHREGMYGIVAYDDSIICTGVAGYQFRVIKLDINGSLLWETQPSIGAQGTGMAIDKKGDIFVVGQTSLYPYSDVVLVKLSQSGSELWVKVFDWGGNEMGKDIEVDWDGNIIVIGGEPLFVLKLNSTGDTIWRKEYPRTGYDCWNLRVWPNRYGISTFSGSGTSPPYYVEYDFGGNMVYEASFRGGSISADKQGRLTSAYLIGTWPDVNATLTVYDYLAKAWAGTVYIRADGSIDPPDAPITTYDNITYTLTDSITSTADGIIVERDNIVIDGNGFTLQGSGAWPYNGIDISRRHKVTIKNTNIQNFSYGGIYLEYSLNNIIIGNNITNNQNGILLRYYDLNNIIIGNNIANNQEGDCLLYSSNTTISGNNITNNGYGISLFHSSNNTVSGNNITNNSEDGVELYGSLNNTVSGNVFIDDGLRVRFSFDNVVVGNTVNGKPLVYLEDASNYVVSDAGEVVLVKCSNIRVEGLYLSRANVAVELWETTNSIISGNNITNNGCGVSLCRSSNNSIIGNNITANINLGVDLDHSVSNTISGNNITNNAYGIYFWFSYYNNTVSENNITNNGYGVYLMSSSYIFPSLNHRFYHNNFIGNTMQVCSVDSMNIWDDGYPSGGNYWSDYVERYPDAKELDGSGLWDTPYVIDENNQDHYPLMYPYGTQTYKLTITTTAGGTTNPSPGTHTYANGTIAEVTAIPNTGFSFDYWLFDGEKRTENPITVIMDSNHTLEAYFVDNVPPDISEPWQDPPANNVQPLQNVTVWVNVTDYGTGIKNVTLWYSLDNGTSWTVLNMTALPIPSDTWITYEATIDGYENCTWVTYKIIAYDNAGNNATKDNNGYGYQYHVIPEFPSTPTLILLMLTTLFATVLLKTKRKRQPP